jgi:hypothetical protein
VIAIALIVASLGVAPSASALEGEEDPLLDVPEPAPALHEDRVSDPHDPQRAMHPYRVAAYAVHPVGVLLDWVLVRPAVWVARREPFRTIFGYDGD